MILSLIDDEGKNCFGYHVWVIQRKDFENTDLPIIINTDRKNNIEESIVNRFDSKILLTELKNDLGMRSFIVEKMNPNEESMYSALNFTINLIWKALIKRSKYYFTSLKADDFMKMKEP